MRGARLLLSVLAASLVLTVVASAATVLADARDALTEQVQAAELLTAEERANALSEALDTEHDRLQALIMVPGVGDVIASGHAADLEPLLSASIAVRAVTDLTVTDTSGAPLVSTGTPLELPTSDKPNVRPGVDGTTAHAVVRAPVYDGDGVIVAWALVQLDLAALVPQLVRTRAEPGGSMTVLDRGGSIMLSTTQLGSDRAETAEVLAMVRRGRADVAVYESKLLGRARIGAIAPVAGTDLLVLVATDVSAAHATADDLVRRIAVVFGAMTATGGSLVALAVVVVRRGRRTLEAAAQSAGDLANTDPLTALGNRRAFDARLASGTGDVSLVLIDVDELKALNDTLGHAAGDLALRSTADAIRSVVRPQDLAARIGGDEFAIVVDHGDLEQATAIAMRVRAAIRSGPTPSVSPLSASTGVAAGPSTDRSELVAAADRSLYAAKAERALTG